jgi:hypothetical protein
MTTEPNPPGLSHEPQSYILGSLSSIARLWVLTELNFFHFIPKSQVHNMAKVFFPRSLLGRKIEFANSESSWILDHKILERYVQVSENQYELDPKPCCAWAIYNCSNADEPAQGAVMKIYKQYVTPIEMIPEVHLLII